MHRTGQSTPGKTPHRGSEYPLKLRPLTSSSASNIEALTGRGLTPALEEYADYITEMKLVKHPFDRGVQAREGIEY